MPISDDDYNTARQMLVDAGSDSASKSHKKHGTRGGSPDSHGRSLLQEARDEFNMMNPVARVAGRAAVVEAARKMGIEEW